jgi:hypothetical protein
MYKSSWEHFKRGLLVHLLLLLISTTSGSFNSKEFPGLKPAFTRPATFWISGSGKAQRHLLENLCALGTQSFLAVDEAQINSQYLLQSRFTLLLSQFSCLQNIQDCNQFCASKKQIHILKGKKLRFVDEIRSCF